MTTMIERHYLPGAASMAPHNVLKELGCGHELLKVDHAAPVRQMWTKPPCRLAQSLSSTGLVPT